MDAKYYVRSWDTGEIMTGESGKPLIFDHLNRAKKYARGCGHTGEDSPILTGYPPIAYVSDEEGNCVYNPRFAKQISSELSGLINSRESDWF